MKLTFYFRNYCDQLVFENVKKNQETILENYLGPLLEDILSGSVAANKEHMVTLFNRISTYILASSNIGDLADENVGVARFLESKYLILISI